MQDKQSIFDELVSQLSRELPPVTRAVEPLPLAVDGVLLAVSAFWAWLFFYVLHTKKRSSWVKKVA